MSSSRSSYLDKYRSSAPNNCDYVKSKGKHHSSSSSSSSFGNKIEIIDSNENWKIDPILIKSNNNNEDKTNTVNPSISENNPKDNWITIETCSSGAVSSINHNEQQSVES